MHLERHAIMKPETKILLLAALFLPGGVLLLLVAPAKLLWQIGADRMLKKAVVK